MNGYPTNPPDPDRFLVYGTLRPGQGNDARWHDLATALYDGEATVEGFCLLTWRRGAFPYAIPTVKGDGQIVGAVIVPNPGRYDEVRHRLDMLEGYPDHYGRWIVTAETPDGPQRCWIYVPAERDWMALRNELPEVPDGDWSARRDRGDWW